MARFLTRFGNIIFLTFLGVSVALIFAIESVFNGGFAYSVKVLWIPIGILIFGVTWRYRHDFERITRRRWKTWIMAFLLYPIALLMSWPYVMALNALTPSGKHVTYDGPVTNKWISSGRFKGYQIVIHDQATQEEVTLSTSEARYDELSEGDMFRETFSIGGLGIPFRWRHQR